MRRININIKTVAAIAIAVVSNIRAFIRTPFTQKGKEIREERIDELKVLNNRLDELKVLNNKLDELIRDQA